MKIMNFDGEFESYSDCKNNFDRVWWYCGRPTIGGKRSVSFQDILLNIKDKKIFFNPEACCFVYYHEISHKPGEMFFLCSWRLKNFRSEVFGEEETLIDQCEETIEMLLNIVSGYKEGYARFILENYNIEI